MSHNNAIILTDRQTDIQTDISFCLPVYNVEPYLNDCIISILDACDGSIKYDIVCIDDGSSDGSYESLMLLKCRMPSLVVLKNDKNRGVSYTRNRLVQEAKGKYIWFVDPDDMLCKNAAVYFYQMIERLQCDVLLGNYIRIVENAQEKSEFVIDNSLLDIIPEKKKDFLPFDENNKKMCAIWAGLFKRSFLVENNITMNEQMIAQEDTLFYYEFSLKTENIYKWNIPCYFYRQRTTSAMHSHSEERSKKYYISMLEMLRVYQEHFNNNDFDDRQLLLDKIHHSKQNVASCLVLMYDKKYIKEQLKVLKKKKIYPYKFRKDALKTSQPFALRLLMFLLPIEPFLWMYHYIYILHDKRR